MADALSRIEEVNFPSLLPPYFDKLQEDDELPELLGNQSLKMFRVKHPNSRRRCTATYPPVEFDRTCIRP